MTSTHTTAAGAVPAARLAPDAYGAAPLPGRPFPLGATPGQQAGVAGTNFAIASSVPDRVTLCLFDEVGAETQIQVRDNDADVWHVFVPGAGPGPFCQFAMIALVSRARVATSSSARFFASTSTPSVS